MEGTAYFLDKKHIPNSALIKALYKLFLNLSNFSIVKMGRISMWFVIYCKKITNIIFYNQIILTIFAQYSLRTEKVIRCAVYLNCYFFRYSSLNDIDQYFQFPITLWPHVYNKSTIHIKYIDFLTRDDSDSNFNNWSTNRNSSTNYGCDCLLLRNVVTRKSEYNENMNTH
jgi:hypothetical protein